MIDLRRVFSEFFPNKFDLNNFINRFSPYILEEYKKNPEDTMLLIT